MMVNFSNEEIQVGQGFTGEFRKCLKIIIKILYKLLRNTEK